MLDMNKLRQQKQKLEQQLSRGGGMSARFWRPSDGENPIRIMPPWTDMAPFTEQFWREVAQHWGVAENQRGPVLCPKNTPHLEGECPICEFVEELRGDKGNVAAQELVREIRAKTAYMINIQDTADPVYTSNDVAEYTKQRPDSEVPFEAGDPKIQVYACPQTIFDQVLDTIMQNEHDVTSLADGNDLIITKHGNKDKLKTRYNVSPKLKQTAADVDPSTELPALDRVGFVMKYDDMANLLAEGVGGDFATALPGSAVSALASGEESTGVPASDDDLDDLEAKMRTELTG